MGIFNLFKKNTSVPRVDLVWLTSEAKLKGTLDYLKQNRTDLCVAWFVETQQAFNRHVNEENHMNIEIKMAESLRMYDLNNKSAVFLEHYPAYTREENLLATNRPSHICFMNSPEDTLFLLFEGKIRSIMQAMGVEQDQYIESDMVSSAVIKAQKKIEKRIPNDFNVRSSREWMDRFRAHYEMRLR